MKSLRIVRLLVCRGSRWLKGARRSLWMRRNGRKISPSLKFIHTFNLPFSFLILFVLYSLRAVNVFLNIESQHDFGFLNELDLPDSSLFNRKVI